MTSLGIDSRFNGVCGSEVIIVIGNGFSVLCYLFLCLFHSLDKRTINCDGNPNKNAHLDYRIQCQVVDVLATDDSIPLA